MNAIMRELPSAPAGSDQPLMSQIAERRLERRALVAQHGKDHLGIKRGARTRSGAQQRQLRLGQPIEPRPERLGERLGQARGRDLIEIPIPATLIVRPDQLGLHQEGQKLPRQQRIVLAAIDHQPRQPRGLIQLAPGQIGDERVQVIIGQRPERVDERRPPRRFERREQPRPRRRLGRARGGEHPQRRRAGQQRFEQPQTAGVGPLQIIEEQHQRPAHHRLRDLDDPVDRQPHPVARLGRTRRQLRLARLDERCKARREVDDHRRDATEPRRERAAPCHEQLFGRAQDLIRQPIERLTERRKRLQHAELLELAADEDAIDFEHALPDGLHHRRLANAGLAHQQ